jgi:nucleoside-diphosphate-sugar epimerase
MLKRKIFITGGTGKIGSFLLGSLKESGYDITLLSRKSSNLDSHPDIKFIQGDILDSQSYSQFLRGMDTVLHMAAVTHTNSLVKYFDVNARGTRNLVKASEENGVKRFIHISTRAISPNGGGYSLSKLEAEKYVRESSLDWVILRPSEVYGLGGNEGIELLLGKMDKMPFVPILGTGKYGIAPLHVSDLIGAILSVLGKDELKNKIYTLAGPENFTYRGLVERIMEIKNIRKLKVTVPVLPVKVLVWISGLFFGDRFLIADQVPRLISDKSGDISLAQEELSFEPKSISEVIGAGSL